MPWFVTLLVFAALTVIGELLRPKPKFDAPQPSALGDFQLPTADGARPIPVVFGTCLVRGANVVWYGDLKIDPVIQKVKTGWFSSEEVTLGYQYRLGMQLALCHGAIDEIRSIRFEDKLVNYSVAAETSEYWSLWLDDEELFGGEDNAGGVSGSVVVHKGTATQAESVYLQSILGDDIPGFHHVSYAVFAQTYIGNSPYLKDVAFEISRFPNTVGLAGGKHIINSDDANPAAILYETLTNLVWGLQIPSSQIDLGSFQSVGDALHAESFGVSMTYERHTDAGSYAEDLLRHIDGVVYIDPTTGLLKLAIARDDYDPGTLDVFDEDSIDDVEFTRSGWSEVINIARVSFLSRADNYTKRTAQQQNLSAIQTRGDRAAVTMAFLSITNEVTANLVAARLLKTLSFPLARMRLTMNRSAWSLRPASVFKLDWPPEGISGMICRVNHPRYGELAAGKIVVEAVEDIFAISSAAFSPPSSSGWTDPLAAPQAADAEQLFEGPYHLTGGERHGFAAAVRAQPIEIGYHIMSDPAGGTAYEKTNTSGAFTPSGLLVGAYAKSTAATDSVGFTIDGGADLERLATVTQGEFESGVNLLMIDDEIMSFRDVTDNGDGTFDIEEVMRGVLDTVPADHSDNGRVWFIAPGGFAALDPDSPYPTDLTVTAKLLPFTPRAVFPIASASQLSLTTDDRASRPYPPGNMKIDGSAWPASAGPGDIVVTWNHRHRIDQLTDQKVVAQDAGDYSASPEGDYTIEVRVNTVLQRTVNDVTAKTWTWTTAMQTADGASSSDTIEIRLIPMSDADLDGTFQTRTFTLS